MSYCRWSSTSDLYIYNDASGGVTVHVATLRGHPTDYEDYQPIGLSRDGETFRGTREEMLDIVESLLAEGYRAPADLLDTLREQP